MPPPSTPWFLLTVQPIKTPSCPLRASEKDLGKVTND